MPRLLHHVCARDPVVYYQVVVLMQNNVTSFTTVLIFGIFCPPGLVEVENGAGIFQDDRLDAFRGAVFKRGNDLGCSYE